MFSMKLCGHDSDSSNWPHYRGIGNANMDGPREEVKGDKTGGTSNLGEFR